MAMKMEDKYTYEEEDECKEGEWYSDCSFKPSVTNCIGVWLLR
jgi:hypothetical protein